MNSVLLPLVWIVPLALSALYIGSARFLGTQAVRRARNLLGSSLDKRRTTLIKELRLSLGGRIVDFDLIVISQTGIFVIDALDLSGRVSGSRVQAQWRLQRWGRDHRIDNPVHENLLKLEALRSALGLPVAGFHPVVAISGHREIKTDANDVIIDMKLLSKKVNGQTRQLLTSEQASQALLDIQQMVIKPGILGRRPRWQLLRLALLAGLCLAVYLAYVEQLQLATQKIKTSIQQPTAFENSDQESQMRAWENSLICSYSIDTERCACYEPDGSKAQVESNLCKSLAEKGSVLKQ